MTAPDPNGKDRRHSAMTTNADTPDPMQEAVTAAALLAQGLADHRLQGATGDPWYKRPQRTRRGRDWQQTYRCKCGSWEGTHADHTRHVADALGPFVEAAVRREVAAAIRAAWAKEVAGDTEPCECETCRAYEDAARIAEATTGATDTDTGSDRG